MKRHFAVWGYKPVNQKLNEFVRSFDLGTDGAFVKFSELVSITVEEGCPPDKLDRQPAAIVSAYESLGFRDVKILEVQQ